MWHAAQNQPFLSAFGEKFDPRLCKTQQRDLCARLAARSKRSGEKRLWQCRLPGCTTLPAHPRLEARGSVLPSRLLRGYKPFFWGPWGAAALPRQVFVPRLNLHKRGRVARLRGAAPAGPAALQHPPRGAGGAGRAVLLSGGCCGAPAADPCHEMCPELRPSRQPHITARDLCLLLAPALPIPQRHPRLTKAALCQRPHSKACGAVNPELVKRNPPFMWRAAGVTKGSAEGAY